MWGAGDSKGRHMKLQMVVKHLKFINKEADD